MSGTLRVVKNGSGTGSVSSQAGGIDCGGDCSEQYSNPSWLPSATVVLSAAANGGSSFAGWSGDGTTVANRRVLVMDGNKTVTATFNAGPVSPVDLRPDLVVQGLRVSATPPLAAGSSFTVSYRVRNIGAAPAKKSVARLTVQQVDVVEIHRRNPVTGVDEVISHFENPVDSESVDQPVPSLLPGIYKSLSFTTTVSVPAIFQGTTKTRRLLVTVIADNNGKINETSESNNNAMLKGILRPSGFQLT